MKQTPLNAAHRALGARMIDFGGWEMPLHYGSQLDEHHRVRRHAGMFDVSHMLAIDIRGPDAGALLRYALANDVARLAQAGRALYSCLLDPAGHVLDDLIVYFLGDDRYRLVVNASRAEADLAWLRALRERRGEGLHLHPRHDLCIIAVQGPDARERTWRALPELRPVSESLARFGAAEHGETLVARTGYTGEDGFELMLPAAQAESVWAALLGAQVSPCGLGARDTLRLEAGMNLYGQDMDDTVTPAESGLAWTVDLRAERDFVGRAALERESPSRRMTGLVLIEPGILRAHQNLRTPHGAGSITSGSYSPTLGRSIALARVPVAVVPGDTVEVEIRGRVLAARAMTPPFVRNGQSLIPPLEHRS